MSRVSRVCPWRIWSIRSGLGPPSAHYGLLEMPNTWRALLADVVTARYQALRNHRSRPSRLETEIWLRNLILSVGFSYVVEPSIGGNHIHHP